MPVTVAPPIGRPPAQGGPFALGATNSQVIDSNPPGVSQPGTFPGINLLGITVELLINGTWVNVSSYVYQRQDITISGRGRPNESNRINPCNLSLQFDNRDGRFSPNQTNSPYYPYLVQNTQIRLSVATNSSAGISYSGYRFWGEVRKWPPSWDPTGTDVWVPISAGGILTRYTQGNNIGSPLRRYFTQKTGALIPIGYWPCEELTGSTTFNNVANGQTSLDGTWTGSPNLSSDTSCLGSDPIPQFNNSKWTSNTGSFSSGSSATWTTPGQYFWTAPGGVTSLSTAEVWGAAGGGRNKISSGAGGEYAKETSVAVTPGNRYPVVVGAGGKGGVIADTINPGGDGANSSFVGDAVTVLAHGGQGGFSIGSVAKGGTGSTNTTHFNGGDGQIGGSNGGGAGGGSSAGSTAPGNQGAAPSGNTGGAGATAPAGGGAGGRGGNAPTDNPATYPGVNPGGGGGGGPKGVPTLQYHSGAAGASGKVKLTWGTGTVPTFISLQFVLNVPSSGMPDGTRVMWFQNASGTFGGANGRIECYYVKANGGQLGLRGYGTTGLILFDTGTAAWLSVNGTGPHIIRMSLSAAIGSTSLTAGLSAITPNSSTISTNSNTFTIASLALGAVALWRANIDGKMTDTAMGHIVLQYAFESLYQYMAPFIGYNGELAADRFARLCAEEGFSGVVQGDGYWSFTSGGTDGWIPLNYNPTPSTVRAYTGWDSPNAPGQNSILVTNVRANTNPWGAQSPIGAVPVQPGQIVTASADVILLNIAGSAVNCQLQVSILFFDVNGNQLAGTNSAWPYTNNLGSTDLGVLTMTQLGQEGTVYNNNYMTGAINLAIAPANSVSVAMTVQSNQTFATAGTMFAVDNARISIGAQMGAQPDKQFTDVLQECEDIDQGMIVEPRDFFGLKFRTKAGLCYQTGSTNIGLLDLLDGTFESGVANWFCGGGSVVQSGTQHFNGSFSAQCTVSGSPTQTYLRPTAVPIQVGAKYNVQVEVFPTFAGGSFQASIDWFDANSNYLSTSASTTGVLSQNVWTPISFSATAPAGAAFAGYGPTLTNPTNGQVYYTDEVHLYGNKILILDYSQAVLSDILQPIGDDLLIQNSVSVSRGGGSTVNVAQATGSFSTMQPPNGVGVYPTSLSVNAFTDTQLPNLALWILGVGTVTDYRYSAIVLNLARSELASLLAAIAIFDDGDLVQIKNAPAWLPSPLISQLAASIDETLNAFYWIFSITGIPAVPYPGSGFLTW